MKAKTKFGDALNKMKDWKARHAKTTDMDRFIVLTFLTAEEKMRAARAIFGPDGERVVYLDGTQCDVTLHPDARFR